MKILFLFIFPLFFSCNIDNNHKDISISLPVLTYNYDFSKPASLVYSTFVILNNTHVRLFYLDNDLVIKPGLATTYKIYDNNLRYVIELNSAYKNFRNEMVNADDVIYSLNTLAQKSDYVRRLLDPIANIEKCNQDSCALDITKINEKKIEIKLRYQDKKLIDRLATPFIIMLKKDRPYLEVIGDCQIPYQTGAMSLAKCDKNKQEFVFNKDLILKVYNEKKVEIKSIKIDSSIITFNNEPYPSLVNLSFFPMPQSNLTEMERKSVLSKIFQNRESFAKQLKLKLSHTFAPEWSKFQYSFDGATKNISENNFCPKDPILIAAENSLPQLETIHKWLEEKIPCSINFVVKNTTEFFEQTEDYDFIFMWFTPDYLDFYESYSPFDCNSVFCYFDWKDKGLEALIGKLKNPILSDTDKVEISEKIESYLLEKGYVIPLVQMNSWIKFKNKVKPVHPAGLAYLKLSDFVYE